jgi:hypothetical protein
MRHGSSQLSHGGDPVNVGKIRLRLPQRIFGERPFGDVANSTHIFELARGSLQGTS